MLFKEFLQISQANVPPTNRLYAWGLGTAGQLGQAISPGYSIAQIAAGGVGGILITSDSRIFTWGTTNTTGYLGQNDTIARSFPTQVGTTRGWRSIAIGQDVTFAIQNDGKLFAWGNNNAGQVGDGTTINKSSPVQIASGTSFVSVSAYGSAALAISSTGQGFGWGVNGAGRLGIDDAVNRSSPTALFGTTSWVQLTMGNANGYGIDNLRRGYGWGTGQWVGENANITRSRPVQIQVGTSFKQVKAGDSVAFITLNNTAFVWGINTNACLGLNDTILRSSPTQLGNVGDWASVSIGVSHALGLKPTGTLWSWGGNTAGQLGQNDTVGPRSSPIQIGTLSGWSDIHAAGGNWSVALDKTRIGFTWGLGGVNGDTNNISKSSPTLLGANFSLVTYSSPIQVGQSSWRQITAGLSWAAGIKQDGTLWSWGQNTLGQLGINDALSRSSPTQIGTSSWSAVSAGLSNHALAIRSDSSLWGWGDISNAYFGAGITATNSYVSIATNAAGFIAIRGDGSMWAWGTNTSSQLGTGDAVNRSSPVQIGVGTSWTMVAMAGIASAYGIDTLGRLYAWGDNTRNALGTGDATTRTTPTQIITGTSFVHVGGTKAVDTLGRLWSWGPNNDGVTGYGAVGDGTTVNRATPIQIATGTSFTMAVSNNYGSYALDTSGYIWAWGTNTVGQLAANNAISRSTPLLLGGGNTSYPTSLEVGGQQPAQYSFIACTMDAGATTNTSIFAIRPNATLWAWGYNAAGQLSTGDALNRSSPTQVNTDQTYLRISIGFNTVLALRHDRLLFAWGSGANGQLGQTDAISRSSPVQVATATAGYWFGASVSTSSASFLRPYTNTPIAAGNVTVGAVRTDGLVYLWGTGSSGQLGQSGGPLNNLNLSSPVQIRGGPGDPAQYSSPVQIGTSSWSQISVGTSHQAAITTTGSLWNWGNAGSGQLGNLRVGGNQGPLKVDDNSWISVSAGQNHTLAVRSDNTLWAWGQNTVYQLGLGNTVSAPQGVGVSRSSPTQIVGQVGSSFQTMTWSKVIAGLSHSFAIRSDYTLWGWGGNNFGQVGAITPVYSWTQLSTGENHTIALRSDGKAFTWGAGGNGRLGLVFDNAARSSPVQIRADVNESYIHVAAMRAGSYIIRTDGKLFGFGFNSGVGASGNLGGDLVGVDRSSPTIISGDKSWSYIGGGYQHAYGIESNGTLWGWGFATSLNAVSAPRSWTAVSAGGWHTLGVRSDGKLFAWGYNLWGQIGDNTIINRSSPIQLGTSSWLAVAAGFSFSAAIRSDGALFTWGGNGMYGLGDGTTINRSSPIQIGASSWSQISASINSTSPIGHVAAITSDGKLFTWGVGGPGLGAYTPNYSFNHVYAGQSNALAIRTDANGLFTWGLNTSNQLGDNSAVTKSSPVQVAQVDGTSSFTQFSKAATGQAHTWGVGSTGSLYAIGGIPTHIVGGTQQHTYNMAIADNGVQFVIRSDGTLWSWGSSASSGQLGLNDTIARSSPVQVGTSSWSMIASMGEFSVGISGFRLFTWGFNNAGQLGLGDTINRSVPTQVGTSSWTSVSAGFSFGAAIDVNGRLFTWGVGDQGQHADLTVNRYSSPSLVGVSSWVAVECGGYHIAAIRAVDRKVFTWGANDYGQLGDASVLYRSSPVQLAAPGTNLSWAVVSATDTNTAGLTVSGVSNLYVWGYNGAGNVGDNTTLNRSSPSQVAGTGFSWKAVSVGNNETKAIRANVAATLLNDTLWGWGGEGGIPDPWRYNPLSGGYGASRSSPIQIGAESVSWNQIYVGYYGAGGDGPTIGIDSDGYVWQYNCTDSTLNAGGNPSYNYPLAQLTRLGKNYLPYNRTTAYDTTNSFTQIAAGDAFTLALRNDGGLFTWGSGFYGSNGQILGVIYSPTQIGTSSYSLVAAGQYAGAAIDTAGRLYMWGRTNINSAANVGQPIPIGYMAGTVSWVHISSGLSYSAAIRSDGSLWTWGLNSSGQLGTLSTANTATPTKIGTSSWIVVSCGQDHTMGIDVAGRLFGWGTNASGQLGLNNVVPRSSPVQVGSTSWVSVAAGFQYSLGVAADGTPYGWGLNDNGQLGIMTATPRSNPTQLQNQDTSLVTGWKYVKAGNKHSGGLGNDNNLYLFGRNNSGQLGTNDLISRSFPSSIGATALDFAVGGASVTNLFGFSAYINLGDRQIYTTGYNQSGQLGIGSTTNRSNFTQISSYSKQNPQYSWVQVMALSVNSTDQQGILALTDEGQLWAWGNNASATFFVGDGSTVNRSYPTLVNPRTSSYIAIPSTGLGFTPFAVKYNGTLWAWGANGGGNIGDGTSTNRSRIAQVGVATDWIVQTPLYNLPFNVARYAGDTYVTKPVEVGGSWTSIAIGRTHAVGVKSNGTLWAWGANADYQLGTGDNLVRSSPTQIGVLTNWSSVAAGSNHSMAINTSGQMYGWGNNTLGQTGVTSQTFSWRQISAGGSFTMALRNDWTVFVWGRGAEGQMGQNDAINRSSPVQVTVAGVNSWTSVAAGSNTGYAITDTGLCYAWGQGNSGQLGSAGYTPINRSNPTLVSHPTIVGVSYSQVQAGDQWGLFLDTLGRIHTAGAGANGALGNNAATNRSGLVQIAVGTSFTSIGVGNSFGMAISTVGALYTWGQNDQYQLGNGNTTNTSNPAIVYVGASWIFADGGVTYAGGIDNTNQLWLWGRGNEGQLGDGTTLTKTTRVQIAGSWNALACGNGFTFGKTVENKVFVWGLNSSGQLGINSTQSFSSPVLLEPSPDDSTWNGANTTFYTSITGAQTGIILNNGLLYMAGAGAEGRLGNGFAVNRSAPVQIGGRMMPSWTPTQVIIGNSSWAQVSAGDQFTIARTINNELYAFGTDGDGRTGTTDTGI